MRSLVTTSGDRATMMHPAHVAAWRSDQVSFVSLDCSRGIKAERQPLTRTGAAGPLDGGGVADSPPTTVVRKTIIPVSHAHGRGASQWPLRMIGAPSRKYENGVDVVTGTERVRLIAPVWLTGYVVVHVVWAVIGPPQLMNGGESYFPGGWLPVVLGVVATVGSLTALTAAPLPVHETGHCVLAGLNALAGAAVGVYSFLFPVIVVSILFEGGVAEGGTASLIATGSGAVGGVLCLIIAADERRLAAHSCTSCGRIYGRSPESRGEPAPGWAFAGAYLAVAGFAARIGVWLHDTILGRWPGAASEASVTSTALVVFVVLMSLAGTLLPLALVHRWGRLWPAWTGPLHGRAVPRWLVLGSGLFVGASLTAYFGIAGMTAWIRGDFGGPFLPLLLEMGGYTLWGVGLLVGSASYFALTRPPCPEQ